MNTPATLGVVTTDRGLVIRGWNEWLTTATGVTEAGVVGRPLTDFVADGRADFYRELLADVIANGTPRVLAPAFHHYLIECAPRQPSSHFDRMQQRVTVAPLRNNAEVVGVLITLEDVTERLDQEREIGSKLTAATPPPAAVLTTTLTSDDWRLRQRAISELKRIASVDEIRHLFETLQRDHHDLNVLNSALRVLIAAGRTVVEPLVALLSSGEPNVRMHAALALGELRAIEAVPGLIAALEDGNDNVRFHAIEALGRIGAADAVDALATVASSGDFFLAFAAVDALSKTDDPRVAPLIQSLLSDETLRPAAIATLAAIGDEDCVPALCALLETGEPRAAAAALVAIHRRYEDPLGAGSVVVSIARESIGAAGLGQLSAAASTASPDRQAVVEVLAWLGPRAIDPLIALVGEPDIAPVVETGLVAIGDAAVDRLLPLLQRDQPATRAAAAALLGQVGDGRVVAALVKAFDDVDETVVCAALASLASFGDRHTLDDVFALLSHPSTTVRHAAVAAIHSIGASGTQSKVSRALSDENSAVREAALRIAGYFGFAECTAAIRAALADPVEDVRRAAIEQLPLLDDAGATGCLLEALTNETARNRAAAAHALRLVDDRRADAALVNALADGDAWVRYFAAASLGEHPAAPGATAALAKLARRDPAPHVRIAAITALSGMDDGTATAAAAGELIASDDDELAAAAVTAVGAVRGIESTSLLAAAAQSPRPPIQRAAILALGKRPTADSIELLSWAARAADPPVVQNDAIAGLCAIVASPEHPPLRRAAVEALFELAVDSSHRDAVIAAMAALTEEAVPDVASGLSSTRAVIRLATIDALAAMRKPRASRELARALRDEDPAVRAASVAAFARLGTPAVARTIAAMRRTDSDANVRHRAAQACERHGWNVGPVARA